jgi:hypothetical protein
MRGARPAQALLAIGMALSALAALPAGSAQDAAGVAAPKPVLEDAAGDLAAIVGGAPAGNPLGRFAAADLTGLSVLEAKDDITFLLAVASLTASPEAPLAESSVYTVDFAYADNLFRVQFLRQVSDHASYSGRAYLYDAGRQRFSPIDQVPVSADPATNTLSATVPRSILLDKDGAAPFPGRALTGFHAASAALSTSRLGAIGLGPGGAVPVPYSGVRDAMPDQGNGSVDYPIQLGTAQSGDARLSSDTPTRASNGEATTMVFTVNATNLGAKQRFSLRAVGVPANWQVDLPSDLLEVPEASTLAFPVLVSQPFAHQHGSFLGFTVEMAGLDDPTDVGRVQLGVRYVSPPQPAGHHDTVFLHTLANEDMDPTQAAVFGTLFGFEPASLYFNTLPPEEDENDARTPVGGMAAGFRQGVPPLQEYTWVVPLSPGLQMGLDFDLARQGLLRVAMDNALPMQGASVHGRIVHTVPDGRNCGGDFPGPGGGRDRCTMDDFLFGAGAHATAAVLAPTAPRDVGPGSRGTMFELPVAATPAGDYIPFHPDASLALQLNLTMVRADGWFGPKDLPKVSGGEMVLPLIEYHDPVDQVFSSLSSLMIAVQGEQQRMVNPGRTAVFDLELMNHGPEAASYDLEITGAAASWAQILGDRRVTLEAGSARPLGVAVTAPASAADGEQADLVLAAVDTRDPSARTLARLLTTVDTDAEHPDDSARVPGLASQLSGKEAPGVPALAALLGLAALAAAFRRRQPAE